VVLLSRAQALLVALPSLAVGPFHDQLGLRPVLRVAVRRVQAVLEVFEYGLHVLVDDVIERGVVLVRCRAAQEGLRGRDVPAAHVTVPAASVVVVARLVDVDPPLLVLAAAAVALIAVALRRDLIHARGAEVALVEEAVAALVDIIAALGPLALQPLRHAVTGMALALVLAASEVNTVRVRVALVPKHGVRAIVDRHASAHGTLGPFAGAEPVPLEVLLALALELGRNNGWLG